MKKVYCNNCRHLKESMGDCRHICLNVNNLESWLSPPEVKRSKFKRKPEEINENNDCSWYEVERRTE